MKKIIIGADHAGYNLKERLKGFLLEHGFQIKDVGTDSRESCDYPYFAAGVAKAVSRGRYKQGILICKSGIGNAIVANRFPAVRAALCYNLKTARLSREHNDANVLVLGAGFLSTKLAEKILGLWLETKFKGGRHLRRLRQIKEIERSIKKR